MSVIGQKVHGWVSWLGQSVVGKNDFSQKDERSANYAKLGGGVGAVVGATAGVIAGFHSQADNTVNESWEGRNITHPRMDGYHHSVSTDTHTECVTRDDQGLCTESKTVIDGWQHRYYPNIRERVVGNYQEPVFRNDKFLEPLKGGLIGAVGGGLVGVGVGLGIAALQRSIHDEATPIPQPKLSPEAKKALNFRAGAAVAVGAVAGTTVGALVGSHAGVIEQAMGQSFTRSWQAPVTRPETLGYIPSDHYERNWFGGTFAISSYSGGRATEAVVRQVPVYDRAGNPKMAETQHTFHTQRYGALWGGIAGGVIGAGVGLAAGLAVGVTDKLLTEADAVKHAPKNDSAVQPDDVATLQAKTKEILAA